MHINYYNEVDPAQDYNVQRAAELLLRKEMGDYEFNSLEYNSRSALIEQTIKKRILPTLTALSALQEVGLVG